MNILQSIAGFGKLYGGIATCTYDLISTMHRIGCPVDLLTLEVKNPNDTLMGDNDVWIKALPNDAITPYEYSDGVRKFMNDNEYDLYHTNGLWMYCNHITCAIARTKGKPYIITPHGMLYSAALKRSYWKKWSLLHLAFRNDINKADCIHVTCKTEMKYVRDFGYKGNIAIIPNPANLPDYLNEIALKKSLFLKKEEVKKMGFLGRLHPIKKVENLLYALAKLSISEKCELVIIGKGDDGYELFLKDETKRLGLSNVTFRGFLSGKEKYEELAKLSCLFVPSDFENFGMIVTEALSVGTPVMASLGTPWDDLNKYNCGWWVDRTPENIADVMSNVINMSSDELFEMGERGKQLVRQKYTDIQIAKQMHSLYEWIIKGGTKPQFIYNE